MLPSQKSSILHLHFHNLDWKNRLLPFLPFSKQLHNISVTTAFYTYTTMSHMDCAVQLRFFHILLKWIVCILKLLPWQKLQTPYTGEYTIHNVDKARSQVTTGQFSSYWTSLSGQKCLQNTYPLWQVNMVLYTHTKKTLKHASTSQNLKRTGFHNPRCILKCKQFLHYSIMDLRHVDIFMQRTKYKNSQAERTPCLSADFNLILT